MDYPFVPLEFDGYPEDEMVRRSQEFYADLSRRRSVRHFSSHPVPREIVETAVLSAGTAPSGAHKQPWQFVLVGDDDVKRKIREAAEAEEKESYENRMPQSWIEDLAPLGTDWHKPFLTTCPWLIVVLARAYGLEERSGIKSKHYYVQESVGIAVGFLLVALHHAGLATLTHTPSPMGFLTEMLERPPNERAFVLVPVGYPADDAQVPVIEKKSLGEIMVRVGQ